MRFKLQNAGLPPEQLALSVSGTPDGWKADILGGGQPVAAAMPGIRLVPYPVPEIVAARRWWLDPGAFKTLQYEYAKYLGSVALATVYPGHWKEGAPQTRTSAL